jgi:hypothetical protein
MCCTAHVLLTWLAVKQLVLVIVHDRNASEVLIPTILCDNVKKCLLAMRKGSSNI